MIIGSALASDGGVVTQLGPWPILQLFLGFAIAGVTIVVMLRGVKDVKPALPQASAGQSIYMDGPINRVLELLSANAATLQSIDRNLDALCREFSANHLGSEHNSRVTRDSWRDLMEGIRAIGQGVAEIKNREYSPRRR